MVKKVKAIFEFWAENEAELSFQVGDIITVINQDDAGWWEGELNGQKGLFPSNYVETVSSTATNATAVAPRAAALSVAPPVHARAASRSMAAAPAQASAKSSVAKSASVAAAPIDVTAAQSTSEVAAAAKAAKEAARAKYAESLTKFGPWSSNMAMYTSVNLFVFGLLGCIWYGENEAAHIASRGATLGASVYAIILGPAILVWEKWQGQRRGEGRMPTRGIVYTLLSIFLFCSYPTLLPAIFLLTTGCMNFVATALGEVYDAPQPRAAAATTIPPNPIASAFDAIQIYFASLSQQGRVGEFTFYLAYAAGNAVLFAVTIGVWTNKVSTLKTAFNDDKNFVPSGWTPYAKGFGALLDLNCALIFLPVCRTLLRALYNRSTADQNFISTALRGILYFVPLDQNLQFHKIIAKVILGATIGHTCIHFINFAIRPAAVLFSFSGSWPMVSGGIVCLTMFYIYTAAFENVKRGQFEIFWYTHHCFVLFFIFLFTHGHRGLNPGYWKYVIAPGALYIGERLLRLYRANQKVILRSVTIMDDVFSLEFDKVGVFAHEYKDGQYIFLNAPSISYAEWHPFTISSAPEELTVTVHIRVSVAGSWTRELCQYISMLGPPKKSWFAVGKDIGPDGKALFCIDGPHSAPTQHMSEYSVAAIIGAGIGATPVAATLRSIIFHRWKFGMGHCFPDHAFFMWVCAHRDIDAFRWLIRNIKEAQDEVIHMRANNPEMMVTKTFEFHIWITSAPKNSASSAAYVVDDAIGFWGVPREDQKIEKVRANWDELDLYRAMKAPAKHAALGDVQIHEGRPQWDARFTDISARHPTESIGVAFCGNPMIARDLKKQCYVHNQTRFNGFFKLHKENF